MSVSSSAVPTIPLGSDGVHKMPVMGRIFIFNENVIPGDVFQSCHDIKFLRFISEDQCP